MRVRVGAFEMTKKGALRYDFRDPYHLAVSLSWPGFLLMFVVCELAINILFASLYALQPGSVANAAPGSFADLFFFSLETLATVGYGAMSPATLYGHTVSAVEIISGLAFIAIMTGLTFVRFSRPRAKVLYADKAVVATYNADRRGDAGGAILSPRGGPEAGARPDSAVRAHLDADARDRRAQPVARLHPGKTDRQQNPAVPGSRGTGPQSRRPDL
jgi:hypothetical protein